MRDPRVCVVTAKQNKTKKNIIKRLHQQVSQLDYYSLALFYFVVVFKFLQKLQKKKNTFLFDDKKDKNSDQGDLNRVVTPSEKSRVLTNFKKSTQILSPIHKKIRRR